MSRSLIRKNQLHPDITDLLGQAVLITGNQTISGNKNFIDKIEIGNSPDSAIYVDTDSTLIISGRDATPKGMQLILANNEKKTSITFDPDYHGLIFQGDSYTFNTERPKILNTGNFTFRDVALLDEVVLNTGNQTISGVKTFANSGIFNSGIDLRGSKLVNFTQDIINVNSNFLISGNSNSDFILANSANQITGTLVSGNVIGFNASIIQIGAGNIQITGSGSNVRINSFSNRFRTSGQYAQVSILHTGNNGYIMYGNTAV